MFFYLLIMERCFLVYLVFYDVINRLFDNDSVWMVIYINVYIFYICILLFLNFYLYYFGNLL